jgi:hypothetical protein
MYLPILGGIASVILKYSRKYGTVFKAISSANAV